MKRATKQTATAEVIPNVRPLRAALYLRVSTGRQAEGEVSLPSQRDLTTRYCLGNGWQIVDEYVEPGATATDDRRPVFQAMLERACDADRPYDVIVVHAFSRFFRDGVGMELTVRKLRRHGVEVVSMTQPTGSDPSQEMMRQIIGIFDEYTSKENGKNVTRAMKENARQGFWNGASPPLGYTIVEAEKRGQKIKKRLAVDPVEAETVRLIYRLCIEGDHLTNTPALGLKQTVNWLNSRGYRTKRGGAFGIGPLHHILTNTAYVGRWRYNIRSAKTREKKPEAEIVEIAVPAILDQSTFDRVQAKLAANNPRVTAPRVVNGPILLTGLASCAHCGGGMTQRTGTSRSGRVYTYYACASRAQKGPTACKGNSIRMAFLDDLVLRAIKEKLFTPERLVECLAGLVEKRQLRNAQIDQRLVSLQARIVEVEDRLKRLYRSLEEGVVEIDDLLKDRIGCLKGEREKAKAAFERAQAHGTSSASLDPEKVAKFAALMNELLDNGETPARKAYLRSLLSAIVVGEKTVRIIGSKDVLHAAISGNRSPNALVRGLGPEWRARRDSNS
ncbi:recombinase family protein [Methylocella sp.]|uniref:recombinase family protein n=1 Tax=Methylocella sp. TaxID=1978226 RepID=UPI0035ADF1EB